MKLLSAMGFACLLAGSSPAWAQMETREGIALQNQILRLQHDVDTMRADQGRSPAPSPSYPSSNLGGRAGGSSPGPSSDITAQLLERVDRLEDSVRQLNGRMDEADNARQRQGADLAKQIADLQFRLDNAGGAASTGPRSGTTGPAVLGGSQAPVPLGTLPDGAKASSVAKRTPEVALQEGNAALARRDYATAEATAREVLAVKNSPRAYDAQFLLAQAMTGEKNYPQAAVAYGDSYDRSKQGVHAQDSLLGLAANLAAINEKRSACAALDTLKAQFPTPRPEIGTRATALRAANGCR